MKVLTDTESTYVVGIQCLNCSATGMARIAKGYAAKDALAVKLCKHCGVSKSLVASSHIERPSDLSLPEPDGFDAGYVSITGPENKDSDSG